MATNDRPIAGEPTPLPAFRIMAGGGVLIWGDTLAEVLEAGQKMLDQRRAAVAEVKVRAPAVWNADAAYARSREHALNVMRRPRPLPGQAVMTEQSSGADLEQADDASLLAAATHPLASEHALLIAMRELARREHIAAGRADVDPPDGPEDTPDPEPTCG